MSVFINEDLELRGELIPYLKLITFLQKILKSKNKHFLFTINELATVLRILFAPCIKSSNVVLFDIEIRLLTI